jgi:hypothetical protein
MDESTRITASEPTARTSARLWSAVTQSDGGTAFPRCGPIGCVELIPELREKAALRAASKTLARGPQFRGEVRVRDCSDFKFDSACLDYPPKSSGLSMAADCFIFLLFPELRRKEMESHRRATERSPYPEKNARDESQKSTGVQYSPNSEEPMRGSSARYSRCGR